MGYKGTVSRRVQPLQDVICHALASRQYQNRCLRPDTAIFHFSVRDHAHWDRQLYYPVADVLNFGFFLTISLGVSYKDRHHERALD